MFHYFFLEYKNSICLVNREKMKVQEIMILIVLIISAIIFAICTILQKYNMIRLLVALIFIADVIYVVAYTKKIQNDRVSEKVQIYKDRKIAPLVEMLQSEPYNLYNTEGINLMISHCIAEVEKPIFELFKQGILISFIGIAYGVIIGKLNQDDIIRATLALACILFILVMFGKMFQSIAAKITCPDKDKYNELREALEYIKVQRELSQIPTHHSKAITKQTTKGATT